MYHMNLPLEILRDTIIVNRPYNDPTEFQIVAVVDSSECGLEAAKDNAKFIVEACNSYSKNVITVDRAQYERMTNFVSVIFGALPIPPHTLVSVTDFVSDVQKLCSDYARGE